MAYQMYLFRGMAARIDDTAAELDELIVVNDRSHDGDDTHGAHDYHRGCVQLIRNTLGELLREPSVAEPRLRSSNQLATNSITFSPEFLHFLSPYGR